MPDARGSSSSFPRPASNGYRYAEISHELRIPVFFRKTGHTMKIQIVKKADKKPMSDAGCAWVIEQLPAPRK